MKNRIWFKAKQYGWGCPSSAPHFAGLRRMKYPSTWRRWLVLLIYVAIAVWNFIRIDSHSHSASDTLINFVPQTFILTLILIFICYKTGEKPRWRWGEKKE